MKSPARMFHVLLVALVLESCADPGVGPDGPFQSMQVVRGGGGEMQFSIERSSVSASLLVKITSYYFRDTLITFSLAMEECDQATYAALMSALDGTAVIAGDFTQTTLPTGTWAYVYLVNENSRREVTNVPLRNQLLAFEQLVRNRLVIAAGISG
jgi:hypothetical protein